MNKTELIDAIAEAAGLTKAQAGKALDATVDAIGKALKEGDEVTLVGFGTFSTVKRTERKAKNPRTGEMIAIPAKTIAKFKPGSKLTDAVN